MKLIILYSPDIINSFVISSLERKYGRIFRISEKRTNLDVLRRTFKRKSDAFFSKLNKLLFYIYYFFFLKSHIDSFLLGSLGPVRTPVPDLAVDSINDDNAITTARELNPDIILVSGTTILGEKWLNLGIPILNTHTGVAPRYRGRFCWFWPIVEKNYELLGVSVHLVNAKVDSGKLISQEFINQDEMDNYKIETVLSKITPLICTCLEHSIDALTTNKISEKLPENNDSFKAYLEPGITDYIKFIKGCHKR